MAIRKALGASRTRSKEQGARFVHDIRETSMWFMKNIVSTHPIARIRSNRRHTTELPHKPESSTSHESIRVDDAPRVLDQDHVAEVSSSQQDFAQKELRSSRTNKVLSTNLISMAVLSKGWKGDPTEKRIFLLSASHNSPMHAMVLGMHSQPHRRSFQDSESEDSDCEDFGEPTPFIYRDSIPTIPTSYDSALVHLSCSDDPELSTSLSLVIEESISFCEDPEESGAVADVATSDADGSGTLLSTSAGLADSTQQSPRIPKAGAAATPAIVLTMPTPRISQSPIFQPRSPITLAKYVQATSPRIFPPSPVSNGSLYPVPSIPSCNRCCLAQLEEEEGFVCRSCDRQWLACKMWYQVNDGGRRRWLTEPLIRPAESTASIRAVMGAFGVPGDAGNVGLGLELKAKKNLPFKVVATPLDPSSLRRRQMRKSTKPRTNGLYAMFSSSLKNLLHASRASHPIPLGGLSDESSGTSCDSRATSRDARIAPHQRQPHCSPTPSYGSSLSGAAHITSSSRFAEHLV